MVRVAALALGFMKVIHHSSASLFSRDDPGHEMLTVIKRVTR